ncbi:hypothetical protein [Paraburkholderia sp. RL17-373-BIF-A]|uniref:hypothetical protein n=1 Tax=Paraburkholderia sp. RL17-373-BIF-A TaxID=3031629 RepID=UPI0038BAD966
MTVVIDVLHGQIQLGFMVLRLAAILGTPVDQRPCERDAGAVEERYEVNVEQLGCGQRCFALFHRGKRLGGATGWHGLAQFEAAVAAARGKIRSAKAAGGVQADGADSGKSSVD